MNNFWIAGLEYIGALTHEEAEDLANNIKNSIHNERYAEAFTELKSILDAGPSKGLSAIAKLENDVEELKAELKKVLQSKKP